MASLPSATLVAAAADAVDPAVERLRLLLLSLSGVLLFIPVFLSLSLAPSTVEGGLTVE